MSPNPATRNFNHLLFQVAEKTFGELAFLLVKPDELVPARRSSCPVWAYVARVEFIGPFGGEMQLGITEDLLHPLATNMLGIEENEEWPEGVIREDALTELLNVTCGNLLPMIAGDQAVFHIGEPGVIPQFLPPPAGEIRPGGAHRAAPGYRGGVFGVLCGFLREHRRDNGT